MAHKRSLMHPPTPHFFKPVISGFLSNFRIPVSFVKHLGLQEATDGNDFFAVLKDRHCGAGNGEDKTWHVRVDGDGRRFLDGWKEFADDHSLRVGDFLVFNHLGGFVFDVLVFDPVSASARSFPAEKTAHAEPKGKKRTAGKSGRKKSTAGKTRSVEPRGKKSRKTEHVEPRGKKTTPSVRRVDFKYSGNPFFRAFVKKYCFKWHGMLIPIKFARENNLMKRWCEMILIDQKGQQWPVNLTNKNAGRNQVCLFCGWDKFAVAHGLEVGDSMVYELIRSGSQPVMKFYKEHR